MFKKNKIALDSGIQTYQILINDEVCTPSLSSVLLAVKGIYLVSLPTYYIKYLNSRPHRYHYPSSFGT